MDEIVLKIAGEITLSQDPGASLKKWREIFGISQTELAKHIKVTPSTISDYEGNRRKSPGINVIKRFVHAICELDRQKGGWVVKKFSEGKEKENIYTITDFSTPLSAEDFVKKIEGKIITNPKTMKVLKIYGYTVVDSLRAILEMPVEDFSKLFGSTTQRAAVFTNVSTGRSPMVAVRVMNLKPSFVVMHNLNDVDKLALKISEIEKIPIVTTVLPIDEIKRRFEK